MNIGIIGLGTVGQGLLKIFQENQQSLSKHLNIKSIVDRSYAKKKDIIGSIPASSHFDFILQDKEIDIVVELIGGTQDALYIAREALDNSKHLVTANKALLAEHGYSLFSKSQEAEQTIGFEASIAGAIPIVYNLKTLFTYDTIHKIEGILNGTSNYILSQMREQSKEYDEVLQEAQNLGFAESDPTLDINGMDACHKLALLSSIISRQWVNYKEIYLKGIQKVKLLDIEYLQTLNLQIKLVGSCNFHSIDTCNGITKLIIAVEPLAISSQHYLWEVENEFNAITLQTKFSNDHLWKGKGAGALPTAFSIFSDIIKLQKIPTPYQNLSFTSYATIQDLKETSCSVYMRFKVDDQIGVMAEITNSFEKNNISIFKLQQDIKIYNKEEGLYVFIITHETTRTNITKIIQELQKKVYIKEEIFYIPLATTG